MNMIAERPRPFTHVARITDEHADAFVSSFVELVRGLVEAPGCVEDSGVMSFEVDENPVNDEILNIQDEIIDRVLAHIRPTLRDAFTRAAEELVLGTRVAVDRSVTPEQLNAIRSFFVAPQERYTIEEMKHIYGDFIEDPETVLDLRCQTSERSTVAGFLRAYVPPALIGRALEGLTPSLLTNEPRVIEFPRWLWSALDQLAAATNTTVSEALSAELEAAVDGGTSGPLDDAMKATMPDYAKVAIR